MPEPHRPLIHPDRFELLPKKNQIIVKHYEKPNFTGLVYLPDEFLEDKTGTIWEVVRASPEAEKMLGCEIREDDIIRTREAFPATDTGFDDERDRRNLFLMGAEVVYSLYLLEREG